MHPVTLHPISKALITLIVGAVLSTGSFFGLAGAFPVEQAWGRQLLFNFTTPGSLLVNGGALVVGLLGMLIVSLLLFKRAAVPAIPNTTIQPASSLPTVPMPAEDIFSILKKALSPDETALLEQVRASPGGITQDSLRFRLNWSKPKVSTLLSQLDRMGLVQRERMGKTYKVHYQEGVREKQQKKSTL